MAKKYKLTGCAKFFIFFLFAAPLAWVGASYYNGQDPIKQVKEFVQSFTGGDEDSSIKNDSIGSGNDSNDGSVYQEMELKELEIKNLKNDLKDCKKVNEMQNELIETQKKEITHLKQQSGG